MKKIKKKFKSSSAGQAVLSVVVFFTLLSLIIVSGSSLSVLRGTKITRDFILSQKSYFLAESGVEDLAYRIMNARSYDQNETLAIDGNSAVTSVSGAGGEMEIISSADIFNLVRKEKIYLINGASTAFHYGIQAGDGGFVLENTSFINGNAYSNGPINGQNSNMVSGDVVSAGANGLIDGIYTTGSAYAHTIFDSIIGKDAHYSHISGSTVSGVLYPDSPDLPMGTMPISDEKIIEWENGASVSVINSPCPYVISSDQTLGSVKINCDVTIEGDPTVTLTGPIWVNGNLTVENTAIVKIDSSLGKKSIAIIVDDEDNHLTGSKVFLKNSVQFLGTGVSGSYILVISQNSSSQNGGSEKAINIQNTVNGDLLLYAGHGEIQIQNSVNLKEVTAYKIRMRNSAQVIYETGLANLIFSSGPSGGYSIDIWQEVP